MGNLQKGRRSADVFVICKVLVKLFSKACGWRPRRPPRRPQTAKRSWRRFFLPSFFFAPLAAKEKASVDSGEAQPLSQDKRPSPSQCNCDTSPVRGRGFFLESFAVDFLCLLSLFLLSRKEEKEKVDGKSKKKKGCSRSSRFEELLSKLKIPPLATDCCISSPQFRQYRICWSV